MEAKRTKVRREMVESVRTRFQRLPAYEPDEVTMTEAVRRLLPDIHALQKKGYSLDAVAELLTEEGIAISGAALKALMRHALDAKTRLKARRPAVPAEKGREDRTTKAPARELPLANAGAAEVGSGVAADGRGEEAVGTPTSSPASLRSDGEHVPAGAPGTGNESAAVGGREEDSAASAVDPDVARLEREPASPVGGAKERVGSGGSGSPPAAAHSPANPRLGEMGGRVSPTSAAEAPRDSGATEAAEVTGSVKRNVTSDPGPKSMRRSAFPIRKDSEKI